MVCYFFKMEIFSAFMFRKNACVRGDVKII